MLDFPASGYYKNFNHDGTGWRKMKSRIILRGGLGAPLVIPLPTGFRSFQLRVSNLRYSGGVGQPLLEPSHDNSYGVDGAIRWMCHYETQAAGPTASQGQTTGVNSRGVILVAGMAPASDAGSSGMAIVDIDPGGLGARATFQLVGSANFPTAYHQMYLGAQYNRSTARLTGLRLIAYNATPAEVNFSAGAFQLIGYP